MPGKPAHKALATLKTHARRVVQRWTSNYTTARLKGFNGLFLAARARARGYSNIDTFIIMIYLIVSPTGCSAKYPWNDEKQDTFASCSPDGSFLWVGAVKGM